MTGELETGLYKASPKRCQEIKIKAVAILEILKEDPYQTPPPYEKLVGDLSGAHSRRINIQHRIVHQVLEETKTIKIIRMWSHYK